mmetsp:Transcript_39004/g.76921  ORF Transcript_39004/g.76921 Transcript_39004/m.76921 type:complete len:227 (-) Transcript_39004:1832-2512(-)
MMRLFSNMPLAVSAYVKPSAAASEPSGAAHRLFPSKKSTRLSTSSMKLRLFSSMPRFALLPGSTLRSSPVSTPRRLAYSSLLSTFCSNELTRRSTLGFRAPFRATKIRSFCASGVSMSSAPSFSKPSLNCSVMTPDPSSFFAPLPPASAAAPAVDMPRASFTELSNRLAPLSKCMATALSHSLSPSCRKKRVASRSSCRRPSDPCSLTFGGLALSCFAYCASATRP